MNQQKNNGFTLIEVLVTVVIFGILLAIAIPSLSTYINQQRVSRISDNIVSSFQLARFEAIKYNQKLCIKTDSTSISFNRRPQNCACTSVTTSCIGATSTEQEARSLFTISNTKIQPATISNITPALNNSYIDPVRGVITFSDISVNNASIYISSNSKQLKINLNFLGQLSVCAPNPAKSVGGYPAC